MQRQRSNEVCLRKWRKTPETMSVWKTQRVVHWGSSRQPPGSPIHSDSLTQHIVVHTAMSYHSDRIQSKVNKEKVHGMKLGRNQEGAPKDLLPVESQRPYLIPPGMCCDNTCEILPTKQVRRDSAPRVFVGGWPHRHSLLAMYQHYTLPKGNFSSA